MRTRSFWRRLLALLGLGAIGGVGLLIGRRTEPGGGTARPEGPPAPPEPASPPPRTGWVAGPAGTLHVLEAGEGPGVPVLLVHGLGGRGEQWRSQVQALARGRRVVALDLRGHGASDPSVEGHYDVEDYAQDVLAVADALDLRRFAIVGHSLGALVAIEVAGRNPERALALGLVDPNGDSSGLTDGEVRSVVDSVRRDPQAEFAFHWKQFLLDAREATAEQVMADLEATPDEVLVESLAGSMRYEVLPVLRKARGPRLCLATRLNELPNSLPRLVPDLPTKSFRDVSHWLMLDRPEKVTHHLADLLAQVEAARPLRRA